MDRRLVRFRIRGTGRRSLGVGTTIKDPKDGLKKTRGADIIKCSCFDEEGSRSQTVFRKKRRLKFIVCTSYGVILQCRPCKRRKKRGRSGTLNYKRDTASVNEGYQARRDREKAS